MTPEERIADAEFHWLTKHKGQPICAEDGEAWPCATYSDHAADLALAAAVRGLEGTGPFAVQVTSMGRVRVYLYQGRDPEVPVDGWHTAQAGTTITGTIEDALR